MEVTKITANVPQLGEVAKKSSQTSKIAKTEQRIFYFLNLIN
jgi:hypothetical protein